jgi:hypothetical protein
MTTTQTRYEVKVEYSLIVTDEWVDFMKSNDGTRHWAGYYETEEYPSGELWFTYEDNVILTYDTETLLRGLRLYALAHSQEETQELIRMETDSHERDYVWQYGFFGDVQYS